jgi:hypothetical protein
LKVKIASLYVQKLIFTSLKLDHVIWQTTKIKL